MGRWTTKDFEGNAFVCGDAVYKSEKDTFRGYAIDHLAYYEDLEEQGRLIILPCKVGDTVYDIQDGHVLVLTVESIHMWSSGAIRISAHTDKTSIYWKSFELKPEGFGKVFFLSREEAEKALEKIK